MQHVYGLAGDRSFRLGDLLYSGTSIDWQAADLDLSDAEELDELDLWEEEEGTEEEEELWSWQLAKRQRINAVDRQIRRNRNRPVSMKKGSRSHVDQDADEDDE